MAAGFIGFALFVLRVLLLLAFRGYHRQNLRKSGQIARPRQTPSRWRLGAVPTLPALLALPIGAFALTFGHRQEWQEEMILRWDSKDAVLRFVQILSFFQRLCATTLAWRIARDCGWLLLAIGLPAVSFVEVWNMSAIGDGYMSVSL